MRIKGSADSQIEVTPDSRQEIRIGGDARQEIAIAASFRGAPIAIPSVEDIMIVIDSRELFNNADSTVQRWGFVSPTINMNAHIFRGGVSNDRTYFTRAIPDSWQGETIQFYGVYSHQTGGLTGAGSPPDDQVKIEIGYSVVADAIVFPNLGFFNDGTAPNEIDDAFQLGTAQIAPIWRLHGSIAIGASDRFLHFRVTRPGPDPAEGSVGFLYSWLYALLLP